MYNKAWTISLRGGWAGVPRKGDELDSLGRHSLSSFLVLFSFSLEMLICGWRLLTLAP